MARRSRIDAPEMSTVESIDEQAARWTVRAVAGPLSPDEQRELDTWLNADPRHRGAYILARAQWVDLDRLATLHGPARPIMDEPGARLVNSARCTNDEGVDDLSPISRRRLLAASVAAITVMGGGFSWLQLRGGTARYVSGIGEIRRIGLEDGSTLLLNTASEVTVGFSKQQRNVYLIRGEALFEVAHDKARPFVVVANDTAVRAVGTAFAVRLESTQVDVTVTEGVVEVANSAAIPDVGNAPPRAPAFKPRRVSATERVVVAGAQVPEVQAIAPAEAQRLLAWREGLVSFNGESLQAAVTEINRHNRRQIIIDDPALAAKPIVGVFRANDLDSFSAAAAMSLKARAVQDGDTIRLELADSEAHQ
jgi:transmembrane sensor